jgi:hypothetical protein
VALGGKLARQAKGGAPPRVSPNPNRMGLGGVAPSPLRDGAPPFSPCGPSGAGGPPRWTSGTLSVVPVHVTPQNFNHVLLNKNLARIKFFELY